VLVDIIRDFPEFDFVAGQYNMWSPAARSITYDARRLHTSRGKIGLIHELGHALLGHRIYTFDMELLTMELDAWDMARTIAPRYRLRIDERHVADCIATYDEWISKRATCPECQNFSLQKGRDHYQCFACGAGWQVNWRKDRRVKRTTLQPARHTCIARSFATI
jgi:hypothetical protein